MDESVLPVFPPIELTLHPDFHDDCTIELLARVLNCHKGNQSVRILCAGIDGELLLGSGEGVDPYDHSFWDGVYFVLGPAFVDWTI